MRGGTASTSESPPVVNLPWSRTSRRRSLPASAPQFLECNSVTVDCSALLVREKEVLPQPDQIAVGFENQYLLRLLRFVVVATGTSKAVRALGEELVSAIPMADVVSPWLHLRGLHTRDEDVDAPQIPFKVL